MAFLFFITPQYAMPYIPNIDPSRRWFAARTYLVAPASLLKACVASEAAPSQNELRLAFIYVLRALRTLHCLVPENNVLNLVTELQPHLKKESYEALQYLQESFWRSPDVPRLKKLMEMSYEIFFEVYATDKEQDLFYDMNEYVSERLYFNPEKIYPFFVKAGLSDSIEDAKARYGFDPQDALALVIDKPTFKTAIRAMRRDDWKDYHYGHFWEYTETFAGI
jgi:hypothetical protein